MNKKKRNIILVIIIILVVISILWINGIIPKQIAKMFSINYFKRNFPKIELEYEDIEWSSAFGDYIIKFKDENNKKYTFCIGPKYFPINLGQGMFEFQEKYKQENNEKNNKLEDTEKMEEIPNIVNNIEMKIKSETLTKEGLTIIIENKNTTKIGYGEWFRIDQKKEKGWQEINIVNKDYAFNALAYIVKGTSKSEHKIDWSKLYGTLDNGQYRLVKKIDENYIAVEFTI